MVQRKSPLSGGGLPGKLADCSEKASPYTRALPPKTHGTVTSWAPTGCTGWAVRDLVHHCWSDAQRALVALACGITGVLGSIALGTIITVVTTIVTPIVTPIVTTTVTILTNITTITMLYEETSFRRRTATVRVFAE